MRASLRQIAIGAAAGAIALAAASPAVAETLTITTPEISIGETTVSAIKLPISLTTPSIGAITLPILSLSGITTPAIGPVAVSGPLGLGVSTSPLPAKDLGDLSTASLLPGATPPIPARTVNGTPAIELPGLHVPSMTVHVPLPPFGPTVVALVRTADHVAERAVEKAHRGARHVLRHARHVVRHGRHVVRHAGHALRGVHVRLDARADARVAAGVKLGRLAVRANVGVSVGVQAGV